jgi:hypothetical protein
VTEEDLDRTIVLLLMHNSELGQKFRDFSESDEEFRRHLTSFANCWPIFEVKELRSKGIQRDYAGDRARTIRRYLNEGATKFEPQCWEEHFKKGEEPSADWPHTLAAIYRVRCNLFHGEKAVSSEMDQEVVGTALRTLVHFFRGAGIL